MSRKTTIEETKEWFLKAGFKIFEEEAHGVFYKYKCVDKNGYLYLRSLDMIKHQLKSNKTDISFSFSTKNPYFYENMLHFIETKVTNGTILLTEKKDVVSVDAPLTFRCGECGREFKMSWHGFKDKQEKCCPACFKSKRLRGEVDCKKVNQEKIIEAAEKSGLTLLDNREYHYHDKATVQDEQGYKGVMWISRLISGSSFERFSTKNPFTIDNLKLYAKQHDWDCYVYNQEYKGDKIPMKMKCSCGKEFCVDCNHFVAGKYRCNECSVKQSHLANAVQLYLERHGLAYVKEKTFPNCKHKKMLPFDFYLEDYNACIEVDGQGHYRPVAFGGNKEDAVKIYKDRVRNDAIKDEYCVKNGVPLLRLPFWIIQQNKYQESIENFILSIKRNELNK